MPFKTGKLKGELTTEELRELLRQRNIKFNKSLGRNPLLKVIADSGLQVKGGALIQLRGQGGGKRGANIKAVALTSSTSTKKATVKPTSRKKAVKAVVVKPVIKLPPKIPVKPPVKVPIKLPVPIKKPVIKLPTKPIIKLPILKLPVKK